MTQRAALTDRDFEFMNLPKSLWTMNWDDVRDGANKDRLKKYFFARFKEKDNPCPPYTGLCLIGDRTAGKTLFLSMASRAFRENGRRVLWLDAVQAQDYFASGREYEEDVPWMQRMLTVDVAVFDNFGDELLGLRGSNWVEHVICRRLDDGLPTLLSTRLNVEQLDTTYGAGFSTKLGCNMPLLGLDTQDALARAHEMLARFS